MSDVNNARGSISNQCVTATYHSVIMTIMTDIQVSLISTLSMFIAQTFHRTVSRCPTKVALTDFRTDTASLKAALRADGKTCPENKQGTVTVEIST